MVAGLPSSGFDGHYGNDLAASVFFNMRIVSKTPAEFFSRIGAFMELRSNANLPCLVNLALRDNFKVKLICYSFFYNCAQ